MRRGQQALIDRSLPRLLLTAPAPGQLAPWPPFGCLPRPIWLELGFGAGEHLASQAECHRDTGFLGCEVFENGIARLLVEIERRHLDNIRVFIDDARLLIASLPEASVERVFILFPDPWPKRRHHKRRLVAGETLDALAAIMTGGAELRLATDDPEYLAWMLERITDHPAFEWLARGPSDWRERPADWPATRYEEKARTMGRAPYFLRMARRRGR